MDLFKLLNMDTLDLLSLFTSKKSHSFQSDSDYYESLQQVLEKLPIDINERERLLSLADATQEPLDQILTRLGLIAENELTNIYSQLYGYPVLGSDELPNLIPSIPNLNTEYLRINRVLPISYSEQSVRFILVDPLNIKVKKALSTALKIPIHFALIKPSIWESLHGLFDEESENHTPLTYDLSSDVARLKDMASEEPIIRRVNRLIGAAIKTRATDIHIEPFARKSVIKHRIDGVLSYSDFLINEIALAVVSRIKILAGLDIAERRLPQDGRFSFPVEGRELDIRVSTIPTDFGESIVMRLLDKERLQLDFYALGFDDQSIKRIQTCVSQPHGIFLVTGPTGSGKTTTLYTIIKLLREQGLKILTIEDPIEYRLEGIAQSQTKHSIGYNFATALRSFLRHDPDVIMVGEIRDLETAQIAIQAALTGHIVLSTLHTNDAPSAITRLLDMGVDDFLLSATLNGVLAQRLVRKHKTKSTVTEINNTQNDAFEYEGRTIVCEILEINSHLKEVINRNFNNDEFTKIARKYGFTSMREYGLNLVKKGDTDQGEINRVLGIETVM